MLRGLTVYGVIRPQLAIPGRIANGENAAELVIHKTAWFT